MGDSILQRARYPLARTSIVDRATISDVLRLVGVATVRRGKRVWFQCAVHDDARPSAVVVGERGWRCFACGAKGGVLDLALAFGLARTRADAARFLEARLP
jgi:CHC2 zinc finger